MFHCWTFRNINVLRILKIATPLFTISGLITLLFVVSDHEDAHMESRYRDPVDPRNELLLDKFITSSNVFTGFDNDTGLLRFFIVPNVVHFIRFGEENMTFIEAVCVLAALKNQRPQKLIIHTDRVQQSGEYWDVVVKHPLAHGVLEVRYRPEPTSIFGQELTYKSHWLHSSDVARLQVLMEEGGIFLEGDSYVVQNLDEFRKFEMTLGWQEGEGISNQAIFAHKHARFLKLWYGSYHNDYKGNMPFYNCKRKPTRILDEKPYLIHRVKKFMVERKPLHKKLAMIYSDWNLLWEDHYVIHLLTRYETLKFNPVNILPREINLRDMVKAVYPFPSNTAEEKEEEKNSFSKQFSNSKQFKDKHNNV